nr:MAG TPA: hypothetical protein [Caudoviricetes sp.]
MNGLTDFIKSANSRLFVSNYYSIADGACQRPALRIALRKEKARPGGLPAHYTSN